MYYSQRESNGGLLVIIIVAALLFAEHRHNQTPEGQQEVASRKADKSIEYRWRELAKLEHRIGRELPELRAKLEAKEAELIEDRLKTGVRGENTFLQHRLKPSTGKPVENTVEQDIEKFETEFSEEKSE